MRLVSVGVVKDLHASPQDYYFWRKFFFICFQFQCCQLPVTYKHVFKQASLCKLAMLSNSSLNVCILWQLYLWIVLHCPDYFQNKQCIILCRKEYHKNYIKIQHPAFFVSLFRPWSSSSGSFSTLIHHHPDLLCLGGWRGLVLGGFAFLEDKVVLIDEWCKRAG